MENEEIQKGREAFAALASNAKNKTGCATVIMAGAAMLFAAYTGFQFGRAAMKADTVGVGGFFWGNVSAREGSASIPLGTLQLGTGTTAEKPAANSEPKPATETKPAPKPDASEEEEVEIQSLTLSLSDALAQVKNGMTYREVCGLLGKPIKFAQMHGSQTKIVEPDLKVYTWGKGPQALVVFERGMVIGKQYRN